MKQIKPFTLFYDCLLFLQSLGCEVDTKVESSLAKELCYEYGDYLVILDANKLIQR